MGRPRIPTSQKLLLGKRLRSYDRAAINSGTFQGANEPAVCPAWLNKDARKIWRETSAQLDSIGVRVTASDQSVFAAYCLTFARWQQVEAMIERDGQVLRDHNGKPRRHPAVTLAKEYSAALVTLGSRFGLDPRSRLKVAGAIAPTATESEPDDIDDGDLSDFLQ